MPMPKYKSKSSRNGNIKKISLRSKKIKDTKIDKGNKNSKKIQPWSDEDFLRRWKEKNEVDIEDLGQRFTDEELVKIYHFFVEFFNSFPERVKIYRNLTVDNIEEYLSCLKKGIPPPHYRGVGIYWSWIKGGAYPYSGVSWQNWVLLQGTINKKDIDFEYFIMKNMFLRELKELDPNKQLDILKMSMKEFIDLIEKREFDQFLEREIPLKEGSDIFIESVQVVRKEVGEKGYEIGKPIYIGKVMML